MRSCFLLSITLLLAACKPSPEVGTGEGGGASFNSQMDSSTLTGVLQSLGISEPADITRACNEARDEQEEITRTLVFPARSGCNFGQAGNLQATAGQLQAQATSRGTFPLPANSLICEMKIDSLENRPVGFADDMFFLVNRMILFCQQ